MKASELIVDRVMGKAAQKVELDLEVKEPLWMQVFRRAVHVDETPVGEMPEVRQAMGDVIPAASRVEDDIVDAELVGPDDDEILWDDDPVLTDDE